MDTGFANTPFLSLASARDPFPTSLLIVFFYVTSMLLKYSRVRVSLIVIFISLNSLFIYNQLPGGKPISSVGPKSVLIGESWRHDRHLCVKGHQQNLYDITLIRVATKVNIMVRAPWCGRRVQMWPETSEKRSGATSYWAEPAA